VTFIVPILLHCNISLGNVTSKTTQAKSRFAPAPLARLLAFVLLAFITHSSRVEIVHRHGSLLPLSNTGAASFVDLNRDHSNTESTRSTGECLICQLHQHLFSTLLISTPAIAQPQAEEVITRQSFIPAPEHAHTPQRGRAPPQATLL
jgi:hypothetical protein